MEPEMKTACLKAGAKLGIGLSLLVAVIGIRLVTTTPEGIESGIEELERLDAQIAAEAAAANRWCLVGWRAAPTSCGQTIVRCAAVSPPFSPTKTKKRIRSSGSGDGREGVFFEWFAGVACR